MIETRQIHVMNPVSGRIDWIDYAKGITIILVVMMHSTGGVELALQAKGWLGHVVEFARPFRIPAFFLIAGLFLSRSIGKGWREYLDSKVLHFMYFYLLWLTISFIVKGPEMARELGQAGVIRYYLFSLIDPFGPLWFIYLLAVFFIVTRLLKRVDSRLVLAAAAVLEMLHLHTGWLVIDEFAARYVYFYAGYIFAPHLFRMAEEVGRQRVLAMILLAIWALANGLLVLNGWSQTAGISLLMGAAGSLAVITMAKCLSGTAGTGWLRYCGRNSLVIYLAFFLPMAAMRMLLLRQDVLHDVGTISLVVTLTAVIVPLILHVMVRNTPLKVLFERPKALRLTSPARLHPAE